jgi:hypothetical protein
MSLPIGGLEGFLGYGISGLGLALAILAYRLLSNEQKIGGPRSRILTSIYVFMTFSLALTAAGLIFELKKLNTNNESLAALSDDSSISFFYDVVKATRQKLFKNQLPMEYQRDNFFQKGDVRNLVIQIEPGQCR